MRVESHFKDPSFLGEAIRLLNIEKDAEDYVFDFGNDKDALSWEKIEVTERTFRFDLFSFLDHIVVQYQPTISSLSLLSMPFLNWFKDLIHNKLCGRVSPYVANKEQSKSLFLHWVYSLSQALFCRILSDADKKIPFKAVEISLERLLLSTVYWLITYDYDAAVHIFHKSEGIPSLDHFTKYVSSGFKVHFDSKHRLISSCNENSDYTIQVMGFDFYTKKINIYKCGVILSSLYWRISLSEEKASRYCDKVNSFLKNISEDFKTCFEEDIPTFTTSHLIQYMAMIPSVRFRDTMWIRMLLSVLMYSLHHKFIHSSKESSNVSVFKDSSMHNKLQKFSYFRSSSYWQHYSYQSKQKHYRLKSLTEPTF